MDTRISLYDSKLNLYANCCVCLLYFRVFFPLLFYDIEQYFQTDSHLQFKYNPLTMYLTFTLSYHSVISEYYFSNPVNNFLFLVFERTSDLYYYCYKNEKTEA